MGSVYLFFFDLNRVHFLVYFLKTVGHQHASKSKNYAKTIYSEKCLFSLKTSTQFPFPSFWITNYILLLFFLMMWGDRFLSFCVSFCNSKQIYVSYFSFFLCLKASAFYILCDVQYILEFTPYHFLEPSSLIFTAILHSVVWTQQFI